MMRSLRRALLASTVLAAVPAAASAAQPAIPDSLYRPDTPAALQPVGPGVLERRDEIVERFAAAYRAQDRPRIAVFWNRRFDDRVSDWTSGVRVSETESSRLDASLSGERTGGAEAGSLRGALRLDLDRRRAVQAAHRAPEDSRPGLPEALALELESGFVAAMTAARAAILDRAAIMRLQDRAERSSDPDGRRIETDALLEHASLLIEVLVASQRGMPLDTLFYVTVKDVRTGQIIASLTADGRAAADAAPRRWEIGPNGVSRASGRRLETARLIGQHLALQTMSALAEHWGS